MPYNNSGTFKPLDPPDFPAVPGTTIRAAQYNKQIEDIADGLSNAVTRDGSGQWLADLKAGGYRLTGLGAPVDPTDAMRKTDIAALETPQVGDYLTTLRDPGSRWLRRNGALRSASMYPELAQYFPPIPEAFTVEAPSELASMSLTSPVVFDGKLFVGVGYDPTLSMYVVYALTDPESLEVTAFPYSSTGNGLCFAVHSDMLFVLARQNTSVFRLYYADNSFVFSFVDITLPASLNPLQRLGLTSTGTKLVLHVHGSNNTPNWVSYIFNSTTGMSGWTLRDTQVASAPVKYVCYGNGKLLLVASPFIMRISTDDGDTFTDVSGVSQNWAYQPYLGFLDGDFYTMGTIGTGGGGLYKLNADITGAVRLGDALSADVSGIKRFGNVFVLLNSADSKVYSGESLTSFAPIAEQPSSNFPNWYQPQDGPQWGGYLWLSGRWRGFLPDSPLFRLPNDNPTTGWIKAL